MDYKDAKVLLFLLMKDAVLSRETLNELLFTTSYLLVLCAQTFKVTWSRLYHTYRCMTLEK